MARLRGVSFPAQQRSPHLRISQFAYYDVIEQELLQPWREVCTLSRAALASRPEYENDAARMMIREENESLMLAIPYMNAAKGGVTSIAAERQAAIDYYQKHYMLTPKNQAPGKATTTRAIRSD